MAANNTPQPLCTIHQIEQLLAALPEQGETVTFTYSPKRGMKEPFTYIHFGGDAVLGEELYRKSYMCNFLRGDVLAALQQLGTEQPITFTRDNGLILSNGVTTVRLNAIGTEAPAETTPRPVIKPLSIQRQPQAQAQTTDALPVVRSLLERSRRCFGRPQVYAEPDGALNVWLDTSISVSVQVSDAATLLTAHRFDPLTLMEVGAGDARQYPPLSGAAMAQLFSHVLYG